MLDTPSARDANAHARGPTDQMLAARRRWCETVTVEQTRATRAWGKRDAGSRRRAARSRGSHPPVLLVLLFQQADEQREAVPQGVEVAQGAGL